MKKMPCPVFQKILVCNFSADTNIYDKKPLSWNWSKTEYFHKKKNLRRPVATLAPPETLRSIKLREVDASTRAGVIVTGHCTDDEEFDVGWSRSEGSGWLSGLSATLTKWTELILPIDTVVVIVPISTFLVLSSASSSKRNRMLR